MHKKILLSFSLLLLGMRVDAVNPVKQESQRSTTITTIKARLGASPYTISLIDLRPHVVALFNEKGIASACHKNFARGVYSGITEDGQIRVFNLATCLYKDSEIFRLNTVDAAPVLSLFDARPVDDDDELAGSSLLFGQVDMNTHMGVTAYDARVQRTLRAMQTINEKRNWPLWLETVPEAEYKNSLTGRITHVDGYVQPRIAEHRRATLFEMFSTQVDQYVYNGIGETIVYEDKLHPKLGRQELFQISLFGILSGVDDNNDSYALPGFFQYTFNIDGACYHRAFKPWTVYHLRSVSNSTTQSIIRLAALSFLNDFKLGPTKNNYLPTLLYACWLSNDHQNWMFGDRIASDRCYTLGEQIHCFHPTFTTCVDQD